MAAAVILMQWANYVGGKGGAGLFAQHPLTFNCSQERLHRLEQGDRLGIVSRCPDDQQYYFVASLLVGALARNAPNSDMARQYGEYAVVADVSQSHDLGRRFPAEGLLRAFTFEADRPIKYGANIGQSLQTLRFLGDGDEKVLNTVLDAILAGRASSLEKTCGLWTKCDAIFAEYFLKNWAQRREPLAFLLYDPPPTLRKGLPVFIHSDKNLRLLARFLEGQFAAGHKLTVDKEERVAERERVWSCYRANTCNPPEKAQFDKFWDGQHGVRGLFMMEEVVELSHPVAFKVYGRALGWGYPMGVGYRYLNLAQNVLLLHLAALPDTVNHLYVKSMLSEVAP